VKEILPIGGERVKRIFQFVKILFCIIRAALNVVNGTINYIVFLSLQ
jgi:hypothetical protein